MGKLTIVGAGVAATLWLAGCSGSSGDPTTAMPATSAMTSAAPSVSASDPATAASASTSETSSSASATQAAAEVSGELCEFLEKQLPTLRGIGSPVGRMANLAMGLATFYDTHEKLTDASALEETVKSGCPAVHAELLTLLEMDSLAEF